MRIRVRLFAGTRDAVGAGALDVELPEGARVEDVFALLCARHPRLAAYRGHALLALDGALVPPSAPVRDGSELALMPPVSGGCSPFTTGTRGARGTVSDTVPVSPWCRRTRGGGDAR